ncbi:organic cation/carnitine transporter 2-like [Antennarius striatus]|uniref:organic cation/carnitine transporter 2-like n=1 Tax=Antennarius striatus TaxID=241820 RepID=UPI0035B24734
MTTYEETIAFLGHGCFQNLVFFLLSASALLCGTYSFSIVFVGASVSHHCLVPGMNLTQDWHNATIPMEVVDGKQQLSRCSRYRLDVVKNLSSLGLVPGRDVNLTGLEQEGCVDGWSYSRDIYQTTIMSEFDLVCSEEWKQPFTSTVFFVGLLCGSVFSGQISDRFGRKPTLIVAMACQIISVVTQSFSQTWTMFCIISFLNGLSHTTVYTTAFVLGTEILTGQVQVIFPLGINCVFSVGYMLLPLCAYFVRDWKSLLLVVSFPGLFIIPIWWFIPESPRWLHSMGKVEEAEAIIRKMAEFNKVEPPPVIFDDYVANDNQIKAPPKKYHNILHLVKTKNIRKTTIITCVVWFSMRIGYFGLALGTSAFHGDPFISCFISAATEIPAYVSMWLAVKYVPRRNTIIFILLTTALSVFFVQLVPEDVSYIASALQVLGKYAITAGAAVMYVYAAELYPTVIRNTGTGTCSTIARLGSCVAPFVLSLRTYFKYLPYITFGTMGVLSAFAALFLPETFRRPLPQTIQEMQKRECINHPFIFKKQHPASAAVIES